MTLSPAGWYAPARHIATARTVTLETPAPVGLVHHATASRGTTAKHIELLADEVSNGRGASYHFGIGRFGNVVQLASVLKGTNHCGVRASIAGARRSVNGSTVGLELENACRLMRVGDLWRSVRDPWKPAREWEPDLRYVIPADEVAESAAGAWHAFTPAQEAAAEALIRALVARFGWTRDVCGYSHAALDPSRRVDPGPLWMLDVLPRVLDRVFIGPAVAPGVGAA